MSVVVETQDLTMRFDGVVALDAVNFLLNERELRCLIGPNGAGKSTFFKCLAGHYRLGAGSGRVLIRDRDVTGWRTHRIVRLGVGVKTQVPSVMNGLTVEENVWIAARRVLGVDASDDAVDETIAALQLEDVARRNVGELAHGRRQMVEIGVVLVQRPWLVLLDEPAAGMTGGEVDTLAAIVRHINESAAVIVVDHDMEFVRLLGSRVTVFNQGSILVEGPANDVLNDARVREVYLGNRAR